MAIELHVLHEDGEEVIGPVIVCDYCGQRIVEGTDGMYLYSLPLINRDGTTVPIFAHRDPCSRLLEQETKTRLSWDTLEKFLAYLGSNLKGTTP